MNLKTLKYHVRMTPVENVNISLLPDNEALIVVRYTTDRPTDVVHFMNHRILRATLAHWIILHGTQLKIDGKDVGKIHRYNEELIKGYFPSCTCHKRARSDNKDGKR